MAVSESNGLQTCLISNESVRAQSFLRVELSDEVLEKLSDLQEKRLDVNAILLELLKKREDEIAEEKAQIGNKIDEDNAITNTTKDKTLNKAGMVQIRQSSRYVPVRIREVLHKEYGDKCSISGCKKLSDVIHHTARFAIERNHNLDRVFGLHFSG